MKFLSIIFTIVIIQEALRGDETQEECVTTRVGEKKFRKEEIRQNK